MLADALGRPLRFMLTGGQVHDIVPAPAMIDGVEGDALLADKAYDSNAFREQIAKAGMQAVITQPNAQGNHPARPTPLQSPQSH